MTADPTAALYNDDEPTTDAEHFAEVIQGEIQALLDLLPKALARQWQASPVPRLRDDTPQRASGGHSDPTADVATDPRRLAIRASVYRSRQVLHDASRAMHAVRMEMERSIRWYDGESKR